MFRARRYRVLLVFAAAFVLAFLHFARSRDWSDTRVIKPSTQVPNYNSNPKSDTQADAKQPPAKPVVEDGSSGYAPAKPGYQSYGSKPAEDLKAPGISITPPKDTKDSSGLGTGSSNYNNDNVNNNKDGYSSGKDTSAEDKTLKYPSPGSGSGSGSGGKQDQTVSSGKAPSTVDATSSIYLAEELDTGGSGRMSAKHPELGTTPAKWKKFPERFPVAAGQLIKLPRDRASSVTKLQAKFKDESSAEKQERTQQLSTIRAEFKRSWLAYKKAAMGHDELRPLSGGFEDPFNGWGATLVDALDTLWIMDLKDEFTEAVDAVKKIDFTTSAREDIPVFETVIRYLGGLLGAYDISGQRYSELLEKARELAEVLIGAFDTPNRMPQLYYRWTPDHVVRPHRASGKAALAELGSLSLEFTRLAQLTQEDKYYDAIARITNELERLQDETTIPGLWPMRVNAQGCAKYKSSQQMNRGVGSPSQEEARSELDTYLNTPSETHNSTTSKTVPHKHYSAPTDLNSYLHLVSRDVSDDLSESEPANYHGTAALDTEAQLESEYQCNSGLLMPTSYRENKYTLGGMADSTYEYLPKEYLLLGGANDQYKSMYKKAIDAARKNLLFRPMLKGERDVRFMASTSTLEMGRKNMDISTSLIYESHHLTCFVGGMVAVGAKAFGIPSDMELAAKLTDGCVWAYESTTTGIMPERFRVLPCAKDKTCEWDEARYEAEVKQFGHVRDSAAAAQYRSGESSYGQRVKMNSDFKPQELSDSGMSVPLPMPGSLNPHDKDPINKRDSFAVGRAAASSSIPKPPSPTGGIGDLEYRDAPRVSSPGPLSQTDRDYHLPIGMVSIPSSEYLLRPEAIESVFIMYRLTGDDIWRRKGWKMFEAITRNSRTELANAAITDVMSPKPTQKDSMESFWLAETLKYFYLLFSDPTVVDLDKYVLNTEAHPFQRPV